MKAGLVGLPNVGKSTLFNALTRSSVPAENYPFCTIEPHIAITEVPDERLQRLVKIYQSKKFIPADVMFADIAGLVKGAAQGEGLGNQFLSHIREVDLIIHVLRCFENPNIIHSQQKIDPLADFDIIEQELMLKDLESLIKRREKVEKSLKIANISPAERKQFLLEQEILKKIHQAIDNFDAATVRKIVKESDYNALPLLSAKNFIIIANLQESDINKEDENIHYQTLVQKFGNEKVIPLCIKLEEELAQLPENEVNEMMQELGIKERGLDTVIRKTYTNLGLITFFTCGPKEIHAWPIKKGIAIRAASGEIHSDLERGFICAEIVNYADIIQLGSETKAREAGKIRTEGKDYTVQDGDIVVVRFNV
ncbi:TPA: redox-regulated ATPase YchF [Candidatus Dependentiae bacterium]|nr:redox-regulated ATPase YchF [Candidatus Dependentiae bacterium]HCU00583.1 redox-regulated ATPase YchF [Candidatus Dependentiae bacterium]